MQDTIDKIKELIEEEGISNADVFLLLKTVQDEYYDEWLDELESDDDNESFEEEIDEVQEIPQGEQTDFLEDVELEDVGINLENEDGNPKTE